MTAELVRPSEITDKVGDRVTRVLSKVADESGVSADPWYHDSSIWLISSDEDNVLRIGQVGLWRESGRWLFEVVPNILLSDGERQYIAQLSVEERQNHCLKVQFDDRNVWKKLETAVRETFEFAQGFPTERLVSLGSTPR